jgi:hypothetical protein
MDSRAVSRKIRERIWDPLKDAGFARFTGRTAWRSTDTAIQVINFQSFNRYLADRLGCTTFSFGLNLGVYYPCIANRPWASLPASESPQEYECHARRALTKGIMQEEFLRPDVWFVAEDGMSLGAVVDDARAVIAQEGLPWLDELSSLPNGLQAFTRRREVGGSGEGSEMYGGALGSPARLEAIAGIALEMGRTDVTSEALKKLRRFLERRMQGPDIFPHYARQLKEIKAWLVD